MRKRGPVLLIVLSLSFIPFASAGFVCDFLGICPILSPEDSLVGYWPFEDSLDDGIALDYSGNENNGECNFGFTCPIRVTGEVGNAFLFMGEGERIELGGIDIIGNELTIVGWAKTTGEGRYDARLVSKSNGAFDNDHWWMVSRLDEKLRFRVKTVGCGTTSLVDEGSNDIIGDSLEIVENEWFHFASVYDGTNMRIYFDGRLVAERPHECGGSIAADPDIIGVIGDNFDGERSWIGVIDEVAVFDKALSEIEINEIISNGINFEVPEDTSPVCGNGVIDEGEVCDGGNFECGNGNFVDCLMDCSGFEECTTSLCGNGVVDEREVCDDGELNGRPSRCSIDCSFVDSSLCGNGVKDSGEVCDDGELNGREGRCNLGCDGLTSTLCGNGFLDQGEVCDDGNRINGDGCSSICEIETDLIERCGNGFIDNNERCDGEDLGGESCRGIGFDGGELTCNSDCTLNKELCFEIQSTCELVEASWGVERIDASESVEMILIGRGCKSESVTFSIFEDDFNSDDLIGGAITGVFEDDVAIVRWEAIGQCDGEIIGICSAGEGEFYFTASLENGIAIQSPSDLTVIS